MCGITGYVDFTSDTDPSVINKMTDEILYRGPDSSGKYISKNKITGLGVRRLSIIDLMTGDQPIKNEDGSLIVVYNGEIYNYKELKEDLLKKGHLFKTRTDTEVLVHGYEEWGDSIIDKLNGMFAFALWDEKKEELFLGRDRIGIKPLYYYAKDDILIFGSEAKSIFRHPKYKKEIDNEALKYYFYLGFFPGEISIYKNIKKLLPGHSLIFSKFGLKTKKYFKIEKDVEEYRNGEGVKYLDKLLEESVESQLNADVPVGVFLSGGLDSSLIAYYVSKFKKLKSFSIGFNEPGFDESKHAHYVSKLIGTEHYSEKFTQDDVIEIFEKVSKKLDEPLADSSLLPTYKVSELAKRYVKVVLSGDGGDELFGGYPTYQAHLLVNYLKFLPKRSLDGLSNIFNYLPENLINLLPVSFKDYPRKKLAQIVLKGLSLDIPERHLYWMRTFFMGDEVLLKEPNLGKLSFIPPNLNGVRNPALIGQIIDFYTYLPDDFLVKTDRASMYNSLEVRVPYLDNKIIDYAFSTSEQHVNFLKTKIQLRKLLQDKMPEVSKRPKRGFGVPLEKWLRNEKRVKDFGHSYLRNKSLYSFVEKKKIEMLWRDHQVGKKNNSGAIWQLIVFSAWLNNWI
jgi:asparagine synthase (glutamine-hydrolysing)